MLSVGICANAFIRDFGRRVFRRPVQTAESSDLFAVFAAARRTIGLSFGESIGGVLQAMLQSPNFLYHREIGPEAPLVEGEQVQLTSHELASRLSYFLTGSTPDQELLQAADDGRLLGDDDLATQARRLVTSASVVVTDTGTTAPFSAISGASIFTLSEASAVLP